MRLREALALPQKSGIISLVGAGGKSTLMLRLAHELAEGDTNVVVTTTTHIMPPAAHEVDVLLTDGRADTLSAALVSHSIVCAACPSSDGKLSAPPDVLLQAAAREAGWVIVEADGARRYPVKAPAEHEPQIFEPSDMVVAVAGLSALGRPVGEICHRHELACALLDVSPAAPLTPGLLARLLTSAQGQFKNVTVPARFRVLLNQADDEQLASRGAETACHILRLLPGCRVVVGALRQEPYVKGVYDAYSD